MNESLVFTSATVKALHSSSRTQPNQSPKSQFKKFPLEISGINSCVVEVSGEILYKLF